MDRTSSYIQTLIAGPDGNLWFSANRPAELGRITPSGQITTFTLPDPANISGGITSGPDGNLWFADWYNNGSNYPENCQLVRILSPLVARQADSLI
ncbi:MAG TPA: hypothetical protein VGD98_15310 [Ktedonobacteraceae bacterium]